jgi:ATP-dependent DNA helicase PIF1
MDEANGTATSAQLRALFITILIFAEPTDPLTIFSQFESPMTEDFKFRHLRLCKSRDEQPPQDFSFLQNRLLHDLSHRLEPFGQTLSSFGLPNPTSEESDKNQEPRVIREERYDREEQAKLAASLAPNLNEGQQAPYDKVLEAVDRDEHAAIFIDGFGGSGKTYLYKAILAAVRGRGHIALAVASSGIAALLLPGGRTFHSRFKASIDDQGPASLNITKNSALAKLLILAKVIVWDEAVMARRNLLEALDHTLRDICDTKTPFGGKILVLGGDWRQTLPVIPNADRSTIVDAALKASPLWRHFKIFKLTENKRCEGADADTKSFLKWVLDIGDGTLPTQLHEDTTDNVAIPDRFTSNLRTEEDLINTIYYEATRIHAQEAPEYVLARAILAPTNKVVDDINLRVLQRLPGEASVYSSIDTVQVEDDAILYTVEFLNTLELSGMPSHNLHLKIGCVVLLLRNLNPAAGLANGTRLIILDLLPRVVKAQIITGRHRGTEVFIPRLRCMPGSNSLPFRLQRVQFPLKLAFAMTISKSQGQSLDHVGLYLPQPVFVHGMLYVATSRSTKPSGLHILIPQATTQPPLTRNVVFKEIL